MRADRAQGRLCGVRATIALVVVIIALRHWLEENMARHMLVQFPALFCIGIAAAAWIPSRRYDPFSALNRYGLTGLTFVSLVLGFWMIPVALDGALASPAMATAKYASLIASGLIAPQSLQAAPLAIRAFFVGNLAWMMATAGLLYQSADAQLCLYYLTSMQLVAGRGLVLAAIVIGLTWLAVDGRRLVGEPAELMSLH